MKNQPTVQLAESHTGDAIERNEAVRIMTPPQLIRRVAVVTCLLALSATGAQAQLRFAAPSNHEDAGELPDASFRTPEDVSQVQFQPINPAVEAAAPIDPAVPMPTSEAALGLQSVQVNASGEVIDAGLPVDGAMMETLPPNSMDFATPYGEPVEMGAPALTAFDPSMVEQAAIMYSTNAWFRRGFWYSQQDVMLLLRSEGQDVHISADSSGSDFEFTMATSMLTSKTVDPTYAPGTRLTVGRFLGQDVVNRDHAIEFQFMGLFDYSESEALVGVSPFGLDTALGPGNQFFTDGITGQIFGAPVDGFSNARRHDIRYDSDFNTGELNYRVMTRPVRDRLALQPNGTWMQHGGASSLRSMLVGLRYIRIDEMFRFQASFADRQTQGTHQVQTANDLYGIQVGGDFVETYNNWSWGVRFKTGGLFNFANRRTKRDKITENANNEFVRQTRFQELDNENLAAIVEVGLMASYHIRPNLSARLGYDAIYITGIATAPENLGLHDAFRPFEVTHDALFHGLSMGVEMLW